MLNRNKTNPDTNNPPVQSKPAVPWAKPQATTTQPWMKPAPQTTNQPSWVKPAQKQPVKPSDNSWMKNNNTVTGSNKVETSSSNVWKLRQAAEIEEKKKELELKMKRQEE